MVAPWSLQVLGCGSESTEFDLRAALSMEAGRVVPHDRLLRRVWSPGKPGNLRVLCTHLMKLRRKLGDDAEHSTDIFAEPGVGYRMPKGDGKKDIVGTDFGAGIL